MIRKILRAFRYVRLLEGEVESQRRKLEFERRVSGDQERLIQVLTDHRDMLLASLDLANRELSRLRARKPRQGEGPGGES